MVGAFTTQMIPRSTTVKTSDGINIIFDHYKNSFGQLVVVAPGFYNSKDALLLKDLAGALSVRYDVIVVDFRGHGKSGGLFHWTSKEYLDLLAVLESVRGQYDKIGVIGFSLGAATAIITASKTNLVNSIVAVSSPSEFKKIEYRLWELDIENDIRYSLLSEGRIGKGVRPGPFWFPKEKPIDIIGDLKQPIFYIHGTNDWIVKPWHSEILFEKTTVDKRLEIIQGGPHAEYLMRRHKEFMLGLIREWFNQTL